MDTIKIVHKKELDAWIKSSISETAFAPQWTGNDYCEQYVLIEHHIGWQLIFTFGKIGDANLCIDAQGDGDTMDVIKVIRAVNNRLIN